MPPAPIGATISYGPSREPEGRVISAASPRGWYRETGDTGSRKSPMPMHHRSRARADRMTRLGGIVPEIASAAPPVLEVRNLTKVYPMGEVEVHALRGVSLTIAEGEFVVLLGPSGSGKSTLLNILGGLDVPTSGEVVYQDHNLTSADDAQLTEYRRTHVGFVFQFYNLIPSLTARENVTLVTDIVEHPMTAEEALGMVGLDRRLDHFPAQLSGGEQQWVAIARAIVKRPDVLLCDEPTSALDI